MLKALKIQLEQLLQKQDITHGFITHYKTSDWGNSILLMENTGKAFVRMYWYNDDKTTVYIDCLSVDDKFRKHGIGTRLLIMCEQMGHGLDAQNSCLSVNKNSWMHDWYQRKGYFDYKECDDENNTIWMRKSLVNCMLN